MRMFECPSCGKVFCDESDGDFSVCPECGEAACYYTYDFELFPKFNRKEDSR